MKTLKTFQQSELKRFDEKFVIPESHFGKEFYEPEGYKPDIWGKYRDMKAVKRFIDSTIEKAYALGKEETVNKLVDYAQHDRQCILSQWSAGRPTKTGYEQKFDGKWYQARPIDKTPKCDCGLDEVINLLKNK